MIINVKKEKQRNFIKSRIIFVRSLIKSCQHSLDIPDPLFHSTEKGIKT